MRPSARARRSSLVAPRQARIAWLVKESGWTVEEEGRAVPIRPRHIAILFRRFRNFGADVTRSYVRALEARRIPHVLVGGRSFHDREEVIALRNADEAGPEELEQRSTCKRILQKRHAYSES
jgi:hypothetical protein